MAEDPDVYEMFPFHLSHKNGITKKLAESMALDATKSIGPAATAESIFLLGSAKRSVGGPPQETPEEAPLNGWGL